MAKSTWFRGEPSHFIPVGDVGEASKWLPYAQSRVEAMMNSLVSIPTGIPPYKKKMFHPAPDVKITIESLYGIPRITIEVGGYDYITVSWYTEELHAGYFGLDNTSKKILDFPFRGPDGVTHVGPNLLHIGGNQFATGPAGDAGNFPAEQVAVVTILGTKASVKYLPRWRSATEDRERIVALQYGGKTIEGVKRIEYLSNYSFAINQQTYPYEVLKYPTDSFWTQKFISNIDMPAYSSTTPLGATISVDSGTLIEEALANPPPVEPVFWIVNPASAGGDKTWFVSSNPSNPSGGGEMTTVGVPGTPAPDVAYYAQWNWRRELQLDITATVETDVFEGRVLSTTVFALIFIENIQILSWDGSEGRDEADDPTYIPGYESAAIVSGSAGAAMLPGGITFDIVVPGNPATGSIGYTLTPWSVASTAGVYFTERRHMVETSAKITSITTSNLGGGKIAILILTERSNPIFVSGGPWGDWAVDSTPMASGRSYLFNMVTIVSSNYGQSWHATITRRTVGTSPYPDRLQFLNTLLHIGSATLLAFGRTYTGSTVWRSTDAGLSYSMLVPPGGIPTSPVANMAICLAPGVAGFFRAGKFYRSIDSGATWTTYTIPPAVMTAPWNTFEARIEIRAIGETYETTKLAIAVSTTNAPNTSKIFLSDDGGATWRIDSTIGKKPYPQDQAIGINIGALRTGLPPTPGLPGIYDIPEV